MLANIATFTEAHRPRSSLAFQREMGDVVVNPKVMLVDRALEVVPCDAVLVTTRGGTTARAVARWRAPVWIIAAGREPSALQGLAFSYGVYPVDLAEEPLDWREYTRGLLLELGLRCQQVLLVTGPSRRHPEANQRLELMVF
jgi:pyruvate kinase